MAHRNSVLKLILVGFWIILFSCTLYTVTATSLSDSLMQSVRMETEDLDYASILKIGAQHSHKNTELAIYYTEMALDKARKTEDLKASYLTYRKRGLIYEDNNLLRKALTEYEHALSVINKLDNDAYRLTIYTDLAITNRKLSNYKATTDYHSLCLFLAKQTGDEVMVEYSYHGLGFLYESLGDYDKAIEYYFKSLAIAEERQSTSGVILTLQNISNTFIKTNNKKESLENIERAYSLAISTGDSLGIANVLHDYGRILNKMGELDEALNKLTSSLEVYNKVEKKTAIVKSLIEISDIYTKMERYEKAQEYFQLCFDDYKEYLSTKDHAYLYNKQAFLFQTLGQDKKAEEAYLEGLKISEKYDYKSISQENHLALYQIYRKRAKTGKALKHLEASNKLLNYIQNTEKSQRIAEMQFQYEVEKGERKIQGLRYSRNRLFFYSISFILAVVAVFLFYTNSIRVKNNKALLRKNEEFENQNKKLEESNLALSQFAYVAAHDLKEPLRNIGSFISLLQKKYGQQFNEEANSYMSYIKTGATRMNNLLVDLLEFSSLTTQSTSNELISLRSVMIEVLGNLKDTVKSKDAIVTYPDRMPSVRMKRIHLVQVFQNLVSNSLKFVEGQPVVNIQYFPEPDHLLLMVEDNGIGINKDYENKVFLLFQQLEKNKGYEGTGIGLTICKSIVEKYNGQIWFESGLQKGTRFFVKLPLHNSTESLQVEQQKQLPQLQEA